jgi:DNA-binding NarL/FixJ family response regulator
MSMDRWVPDALRGKADGQELLFSVLVVGSGGVLAEALTRLLLAEGVAATHADDHQIEMALVSCRLEAVVLDGDLGHRRLVECAELVRRACPGARVLLLATGEEDDAFVRRLQAAVVLSAWSAPEDLFKAISGTTADHCKGRKRRPARGQHHRGRPSERFHSRISQLTGRELQILRMLMAGASGVQIAEALAISPQTVRTHVQNMLAKLDARTRLQAMTIGFREGLRPLDRFRPSESRLR